MNKLMLVMFILLVISIGVIVVSHNSFSAVGKAEATSDMTNGPCSRIGDGLTIKGIVHRCESIAGAQKWRRMLLQPCSRTAQCGNNAVCGSNICLLPEGGACRTDQDCVSRICEVKYGSNHCVAARDDPNSYQCQGLAPEGAVLCPGDDAGLPFDAISRSLFEKCSNEQKCEYYCPRGKVMAGEHCRDYVCRLPIQNSIFCEGENLGLTRDTISTLIDTCNANRADIKCESICAPGYRRQGVGCVLDNAAHCGISPGHASLCSGDDALPIPSGHFALPTRSCTDGRKCEFLCNEGYIPLGRECVPIPAADRCIDSDGGLEYSSGYAITSGSLKIDKCSDEETIQEVSCTNGRIHDSNYLGCQAGSGCLVGACVLRSNIFNTILGAPQPYAGSVCERRLADLKLTPIDALVSASCMGFYRGIPLFIKEEKVYTTDTIGLSLNENIVVPVGTLRAIGNYCLAYAQAHIDHFVVETSGVQSFYYPTSATALKDCLLTLDASTISSFDGTSLAHTVDDAIFNIFSNPLFYPSLVPGDVNSEEMGDNAAAIKGDLNNDGCVNFADISLIAPNVDFACPSAGHQVNANRDRAGDLDHDGCVNFADISLIAPNVNFACVAQ